MTLNAKIGVFGGFFGDFGLRDIFQERIAPKPIEIDMDKLRTRASKSGTPVKVATKWLEID